MADTLTSDQPVEEHRFPCSACGSDLRYAPGTETLTCDHCGNVDQIEGAGPWEGAQAIAELDFDAAVRGEVPPSAMEITRVAQCNSCGAEVEFDPAIHSKECPFCASPLVTDTGAHRHIKPRALLPFGLKEEEARAAMGRWLGRLWFAPNGLQDYARKGRRLQGLYVPYWTYDAPTRSAYTGQRGDAYWTTQTRVVDGERKQVRVQKIRWTRVRGQVSCAFDDVLVLASQTLPKSYTDALEPWDVSGLKPYRPDYLAGFRAEGYQVPLADGWTEARARIDTQIALDIRRDIGGDQQRIDRVDTQVGKITFKHVLLPIWMAAYKFRGQTYRFVVNGRTGEVKGERPYSTGKILVAVLLALLGAAALLYLGSLQD
ncbi:MAG: primosomal protein N' (replication factor Y) - superfamily II helicase [Pseudomonadota bacterium]